MARSLYEAGWRQGSILHAPLAYMEAICNKRSAVVGLRRVHHDWVVATQDCDLDQVDETAAEPVIELRPIFSAQPPAQAGLRSRKLLLTPGSAQYIEAQSFRVMVSPAALTRVVREQVQPPAALLPSRRLALKIWLGKRYDRPAVPPEYVPLARAIAHEIARKPHRQGAGQVRDVLIQFAGGTPPLYNLTAVIEEGTDRAAMRLWLAGIARQVDPALGTADALEVGTSKEVSLYHIETSYAADASDITWGRGDPAGAI